MIFARPRTSTELIALTVALFLFFASIWHLKPWSSDDSPEFPSLSYERIQTGPNSAPSALPTEQVELESEHVEVPGVDIVSTPGAAEKPFTVLTTLNFTMTRTMTVTETPTPTKRPSFYEIAKKYGTDKVTHHHYNWMYEKYLEPVRDQKLKMLEIGLGCDMGYGPGASYHTWLEFLPVVDLYYIEYDAECADKWAGSTKGATITSGDQADIAFLQNFMETYGTDFDIIIDDGGHTMEQQRVSLNALFRAVKPGGYYFIEDLETSYMGNYDGGEGKNTMMEWIKNSLDDMTSPARQARPKHTLMKEVRSIECMKEVCALTKTKAGDLDR